MGKLLALATVIGMILFWFVCVFAAVIGIALFVTWAWTAIF